MKPRDYSAGHFGWPAPVSIPQQMPDNAWERSRETVLVDVKGNPLVVKEPRRLGFRPPNQK